MKIEEAIMIAVNAHCNQLDKAGEPYILHPLFVMERMDTIEEKIVAVLHDVIEDTSVTIESLCNENSGLTEIQKEALILLTHEKGIPYMDYIYKLASNPIARKVKIADLIHNMDFKRIEKVIENSNCDMNRFIKKQEIYAQAYHYLTNYINCSE